MINSDEHRNNPKILIVNHCAFVLPNILDTQLLYMLPISCEDIMTRYDISSNQQKINNGKINYYDILFIVKNKHDSCEINETEIYNLKKNDKKIIDSDYDHIKFPFIENITETKISIFGDCMTEEELTIFCHEKLSIKTVLTSCPRSNINNSTTDYISTDKKYEFIKIKEHNCCLLSRCVDSSNNAIINQKHTQKLQNTMNNSFNDSLITITPDISLSFPVIGISIQDVTENIHCDSSWIKNKYGTIIFN
jgi:CRISPR/Cas system-associated endoribonuclease Cas2